MTITIVGVGYTTTVKYPAIDDLSLENHKKLLALLRGQEEDVLARWCLIRAPLATYNVLDGGEVVTNDSAIEPVTILGSQGLFNAIEEYSQGAYQVNKALASFEGHTVRRISVVSLTDLYIVYTDVEITEYLGIVRSPLMSLGDLAEKCTASQGIVIFGN